MSKNPVRTLQLASEYFSLLSYVAEHGEPVALSELRSLHKKHKPDDERTTERLTGLLEEFGLFERSADSDTAWEVPHIVGEFFRHLMMRQRLAAPGILAPIIEEIALLTEELRQATAASDVDRIKIASASVRQTLDVARSLSRENYQAILNEVMRIKSQQDNRTLRERFLFISHLHDRHLATLGGLVDVGGEMELRATELIGVARYAKESMANDPFVPDVALKIISTVRRLKDEAWRDFHSALGEVTPLFRKLRRDHAIARAVSALLESYHRLGEKALETTVKQLQIARWRTDNVLSRFAIQDYLTGVDRYAHRAEPGPIITNDSNGGTRFALNATEVAAQLLSEGEQPDLLKWLIERFSEFPDQQILQSFHSIADNETFSAIPADAIQSIDTPDARYTYYPMKIAPNA